MLKVFFYYIIVRKSDKTAKSSAFAEWEQDDEMFIIRCMSEPDIEIYLKKITLENLLFIEDYIVGVYDVPFKVKPMSPAPWIELKQNRKGQMIARYLNN